MIIFGTRSKVLSGSTATADCDYCSSKQTVRLSFVLRYFHIFWIPMFPLSKTGVSQCSHCKQTLYANQMPNALKMVYEEEKKKVKTPWAYRFGLILIGLFFAFVIASILFGGVNKKYLNQPMVNDIYEVKYGNRQYVLYKVIAVNGSDVVVVESVETGRKASDLSKIKKDGVYQTSEITFTKAQLEELVKERKLRDIEREKQ